MSTSPSVVTSRDRDCFLCRITSGSGLIGAGLYVSYHSKKFNKKPGKTMMFSIASGKLLPESINKKQNSDVNFFFFSFGFTRISKNFKSSTIST